FPWVPRLSAPRRVGRCRRVAGDRASPRLQPSPRILPVSFPAPDLTPMHRRAGRRSNYEKRPFVPIGTADACAVGDAEIVARLAGTGARVFIFEAYPGVHRVTLLRLARGLGDVVLIDAADALRPSADLDRRL